MELPSYRDIKIRFPCLPGHRRFIDESRQTIRAILRREDPRLLLVAGPCSIHDSVSAKEFASHFGELARAVESTFFLVMRVYCEKPRTGSGWKGYLYDPFLDGSHATHLGIQWTRQLLLELAEMRVPAATEFLDPLTAYYHDDLITWGSIGARTSSSQPHRQLASALAMPIGFKNGIAGNISAAIQGALFATLPQMHLRLCEEGKASISRSAGNPDTHIVLRGGDAGPNYDPASVSSALTLLQQATLQASLLIDCSHGNSGKAHDRQTAVFQSIIQQITEGNGHIRGLMLESHLQAGNQIPTKDRNHLEYGVSITDACLDWPSTAELITWGADRLCSTPLSLPPICAIRVP